MDIGDRYVWELHPEAIAGLFHPFPVTGRKDLEPPAPYCSCGPVCAGVTLHDPIHLGSGEKADINIGRSLPMQHSTEQEEA